MDNQQIDDQHMHAAKAGATIFAEMASAALGQLRPQSQQHEFRLEWIDHGNHQKH